MNRFSGTRNRAGGSSGLKERADDPAPSWSSLRLDGESGRSSGVSGAAIIPFDQRREALEEKGPLDATAELGFRTAFLYLSNGVFCAETCAEFRRLEARLDLLLLKDLESMRPSLPRGEPTGLAGNHSMAAEEIRYSAWDKRSSQITSSQ